MDANLPITTSFKLGFSAPLQLRPSLLKGITDDPVCPDVQLRKDYVLILLRTVELRPPDAVAAGKVEIRHRYANLHVCSKLWPYRTIISFFSKALSNPPPTKVCVQNDQVSYT